MHFSSLLAVTLSFKSREQGQRVCVCAGYLEMQRYVCQEVYCNTTTAIILQDGDNLRHVLHMELCGNELSRMWLCIIVDMTHCSANGCSYRKGVELHGVKKKAYIIFIRHALHFVPIICSTIPRLLCLLLPVFHMADSLFLTFSNVCKNKRTTRDFRALSPHIIIRNDRYVRGQALQTEGIQLVAHLW